MLEHYRSFQREAGNRLKKFQLKVHIMCWTNLEHSEQRLHKGVEVVPRLLLQFFVAEAAAEHLHAKQGEDDNEQEQQEQQADDGTDRID